MPLSSNPDARANQLANLRPISADPERASAQAKLTGLHSGKLKRCNATTNAGTPCKNPAAWGTPKCTKHGAYRFKSAPLNPYAAHNYARKLLGRETIPIELQRAPSWLAAEKLGANQWPTKLGLLRAWQAAQNGNPEPWQKQTKPT